MDAPWMKRILQAVVIVTVLIIVIMTAVRLLLTETFLKIEYNMPYFPADTYGMTQEERLKWAPFALDYLLNSEDISYLGDLTFEDGAQMYNERELSHMLDVKILVQQTLNVWYISIGVFFGLAIWAWVGKWWEDFRKMLSISGLTSVILLGTVILAVLLSFDQLFTGFHRIFFEGDTWLFLFSDTLIRLFPMRFWQDAFTFVGLFTLLVGLALWRFAPARKAAR